MGYEVVGTWKQILHWGPLVALSVTFTVTAVTVRCSLMWWPPLHTVGGFCNLTIFLTIVSMILVNYFRAMFKGPGFVPFHWTPADPVSAECMQFCDLCKGYKAPRSHHCRKCDRCVMKMDHHCPWINTCCGHWNHANFCYFLFFAPCGCMHAVCVLIPSIYRAIHFEYYFYHQRSEPLVHLDKTGFMTTLFGLGLAIGVIVSVGMLFYIQMKNVWKNETGIESWIIDKALDRKRNDEEGPFVYPYNLGWYRNMVQVFTWSGQPPSDGYTWDLVEGCTQFTLTVEQLKQKAEKHDRAIHYTAVESYSGRLFPCSKGLKVAFCIPCTDEARIALQVGDILKVTRWNKRWLYGTNLSLEAKKGQERQRGWFPRRCAQELSAVNGTILNKKDS